MKQIQKKQIDQKISYHLNQLKQLRHQYQEMMETDNHLSVYHYVELPAKIRFDYHPWEPEEKWKPECPEQIEIFQIDLFQIPMFSFIEPHIRTSGQYKGNITEACWHKVEELKKDRDEQKIEAFL